MCADRPVLLVGSVPLESPSAVFAEAGARLGSLAKRVPDGETGVRKDWIFWQGAAVAQASGLAPGGTRPLQGGYEFQLYRLAGSPADVEFGHWVTPMWLWRLTGNLPGPGTVVSCRPGRASR
jgi:hypothetical protein